MRFVEATLQWQRRALGVAVAGPALVFWRGAYDIFNTTKATLIAVAALVIVVLSAVRVLRTRRIVYPRTPALWWVLGAFAVALLVTALTSDRFWISVVGRAGRHTGVALYLVYALLLLAAVRLYRDHRPDGLLRGLLIVAVPVIGYGLLQAAGFEPFGWEAIEGGPQVFSTFGNANFFSGWVGIIVPIAVYGALADHWHPFLRALAVLVGIGGFAAALASQSLQGPASALIGTAVVVAVWLFTTQGPARRMRAPLLFGGLTLGVAGFAALVVGIGPLATVRDMAARSLQNRLDRWAVALDMAGDRPLTGFGLGTFGDWIGAYWSTDLAVDMGLRRVTDSPHNVPLEMLVSGGLLLGLTYLAVIAWTGWTLATGLQRSTGQQRLLLGGLGGAWLAYQAQSFVSIDVPPLAVLHWVLVGLIVAASTPDMAVRALPGAPQQRTAPPGRKRKKKTQDTVPLATAPAPALAGVAILALLGLYVVSAPWRADLAAGAAQRAAAASEVSEAERRWQRAADVGFWEPRYPAGHAQVVRALGDDSEALALYEEAARRDPRGVAHHLEIGLTASALDLQERADEAFATALELHPRTPEVLAEAGIHELARDRGERATALLERAVELRPRNPEWWVALGEARAAAGDMTGARSALTTALELDPSVEGAEEALADL